jgi:hypothetical protein
VFHLFHFHTTIPIFTSSTVRKCSQLHDKIRRPISHTHTNTVPIRFVFLTIQTNSRWPEFPKLHTNRATYLFCVLLFFPQLFPSQLPLNKTSSSIRVVFIRAKLRGRIGLQSLIGPYNSKGEKNVCFERNWWKRRKTKEQRQNGKGSKHNNRNTPPVGSLDVSNTRTFKMCE